MRSITVVGCGFVGSVFTTEYLKRALAGELPHPYRFIDDDVVSTRNCANQNFSPTDVGKPKAEVLATLAQNTYFGAEVRQVRLTAENIDELLADSALVIDGVDNLATRQLLWSYAHRSDVPVLHLGLSESGTGKVEWSHPLHDTFSLAPTKTIGKTIVDPTSGVTPPCELARMRGSGLAVGFAAAIAAAMHFGFDPESYNEGLPSGGLCSEWLSTPTSFMPRRETWSYIR